MVEDKRKSNRPVSNTMTISSGDGTIQTALSLRDEETLAIEEIKIEYLAAGTTATLLELHDEDSGITDGDEDNPIDKFEVEAGDLINPDMVWSDVEKDVMVTTDGTHDADIHVTVGGYIVTG